MESMTDFLTTLVDKFTISDDKCLILRFAVSSSQKAVGEILRILTLNDSEAGLILYSRLLEVHDLAGNFDYSDVDAMDQQTQEARDRFQTLDLFENYSQIDSITVACNSLGSISRNLATSALIYLFACADEYSRRAL